MFTHFHAEPFVSFDLVTINLDGSGEATVVGGPGVFANKADMGHAPLTQGGDCSGDAPDIASSRRVASWMQVPATDEQRASGRPFLSRPLAGAKQAWSWRAAGAGNCFV